MQSDVSFLLRLLSLTHACLNKAYVNYVNVGTAAYLTETNAILT